MGKTIFTTELNDKKVIYHGGEAVSGQLVFVNDKSFNIDSVQVTFSGKAFVYWEEGAKHKKIYSDEQRLFKEKVCLSGSLKPLNSGRSTFPFSFNLPQELPSSIEVSDGYVRYSVKGLVKRPGLHKNLTTKVIFTVLDVLDLNQVPLAQYPSSGSNSKNLCCWCCSSGLIEGNVNADKTGYVLGESIKATASIENLSDSDIRGSYFSIVQRVTKHAMGKSNAICTELMKAPGIPCKRRSTVQLRTQALQVPASVPQSPLRFCRVMDIEYFLQENKRPHSGYTFLFTLQLNIHTGACHLDLQVMAPLVIGIIPLRVAGTGQPATASVIGNTAETSFQPLTSPPIARASYANQVPPPSYARATSVNTPRKKDYGGPTASAQQQNYYEWSQKAFTYK